MEDQRICGTGSMSSSLPLHTLRRARRTPFNRVFAAVYLCAILALFYYHASKLTHSSTWASFFISLTFFLSDIVLAFMWATRQCFLMTIVYRDEYPDKLQKVLKKSDFPALTCLYAPRIHTREPPLRLVSTALSVMAYDYPTEKISVYVSDDGGSQVTLFACMEAAKFASHWIPFCRKNNIIDRSPEAYFASNHSWSSDSEKIKMGFRYGSLVEDYYTGFRLHCEGWRSIFCNPKRPAFLGDAPICLLDALNQLQRWMIGALQVSLSKFTPIIFGTRSMGLLMGLAYAHYSVFPFWFFPHIVRFPAPTSSSQWA